MRECQKPLNIESFKLLHQCISCYQQCVDQEDINYLFLSDRVKLNDIANFFVNKGLMVKSTLPFYINAIFEHSEKQEIIVPTFDTPYSRTISVQEFHIDSRKCQCQPHNAEVQLYNYTNECNSSSFKNQLKLLIDLELQQASFVEFINWPIYQIPQKNYEHFQKWGIVTAQRSVSLKLLIDSIENIRQICLMFDVDLEYFFYTTMIQVIKCIYYLHSFKIAHRNIKPCNIIFSIDNNSWKLNHLEYQIQYENYLDFYYIVGDANMLEPHLSNLLQSAYQNFEIKKKVKQNLLHNDIYAVYCTFKGLFTQQTYQYKCYLLLENVYTPTNLYDYLNNIYQPDLYFLEIIQKFYNYTLSHPGDKIIIEQYWLFQQDFYTQIQKQLKEQSNLIYTNIKQMIHLCDILELYGWGSEFSKMLEYNFLQDQIQSKNDKILTTRMFEKSRKMDLISQFSLQNFSSNYLFCIKNNPLNKLILDFNIQQIFLNYVPPQTSLEAFLFLNDNLQNINQFSKEIWQFQKIILKEMISLIETQQILFIGNYQNQLINADLKIFGFDFYSILNLLIDLFNKNQLFSFHHIMQLIINSSYFQNISKKQLLEKLFQQKLNIRQKKLLDILFDLDEFKIEIKQNQLIEIQLGKTNLAEAKMLFLEASKRSFETEEDFLAYLFYAKILMKEGLALMPLRLLDEEQLNLQKFPKLLPLIEEISLQAFNLMGKQKICSKIALSIDKNSVNYLIAQEILANTLIRQQKLQNHHLQMNITNCLLKIKMLRNLNHYEEAQELSEQLIQNDVKIFGLQSGVLAQDLFELSRILFLRGNQCGALKELKASQLQFLKIYENIIIDRLIILIKTLSRENEKINDLEIIQRYFATMMGKQWRLSLGIQGLNLKKNCSKVFISFKNRFNFLIRILNKNPNWLSEKFIEDLLISFENKFLLFIYKIKVRKSKQLDDRQGFFGEVQKWIINLKYKN